MNSVIISFKKIIYFIAIFLIVFASCKLADKKLGDERKGEIAETRHGWVSLFDGATTAGWHTYGQDHVGKSMEYRRQFFTSLCFVKE